MTTVRTIDTAHSDVQFKIKHLVISTVTGSFKNFSGTVTADNEDFTDALIQFEIDVASVDTNNEQRDEHLRASDMFDIATYPTISFVSTSFQKVTGNTYNLIGDLTMRGITKSVTLEVEFGGLAVSPYGVQKAGFEITGVIVRNDFGITLNQVLDTGGMMLGETVKLLASIQLDKQAA